MADPTGTATGAPLGTGDVLRLPAFRRLWLGQVVSDAGDGLTNLVLLLLIHHLTGSAAALAAMAIALALPSLTVGLAAGAYVDRWDRRRVMLAADLLRAVGVLGFIVVGSADALPILLGLAAVQATVGTFFTPARGATVPRIVPPEGLLAANSLSQATRVVAWVIGTAVAGALVGGLGVYWPAFVLDGLTFLASFALLRGLPIEIGRPETAPAGAAGSTEATAPEAAPAGGPGPSIRASIVEGLRLVLGDPQLATTLAGLSFAMLGLGAINVLFIPLVVEELGAPEIWFGPLEFAQSASMILAAGIVATIARRLAASSIVSLGMLGIGLLVAIGSLVQAPWQLLVVMFGFGWFLTPLQAAVVTIFQTGVPDRARGRAMAALGAAMNGASVASTAAAGLLADAIGVRTVYVVGGGIVVAGAILTALRYRTTKPNLGREPGVAEPGPDPWAMTPADGLTPTPATEAGPG